jgi:H+/Cl- antiporter ClcA
MSDSQERAATGRISERSWWRATRITLRRSRRRLTFLAGGVVVGGVAVAFAALADRAQLAFHGMLARWPWLPLLVTPAVFAAIAYVTRTFAPQSSGSGIPQVIAARRLRPTGGGAHLVSLRVAGLKIALTLLGLLGGASIGREGPTVQIGAAIMSSVGRLTRIDRAGLLLAGSCAGIAAAFNTPLAGIVFGIEEMSQSFERRTNGLTLVAVIIAGLVSLALVGNYTYFGVSSASLPLSADWLAVVLCGVAGGGLGGLFSRTVIAISRGLPGRLGRFVKESPLSFAAACGAGVALCGLASANTIFGTGYSEARALFDAHGAVPYTFALLKIAATFLSTVSGIPGGIFSPSLAIGAGIGLDAGLLFPHADPGALFLLGMVSYLTGVVQAPITAFVIVTEMTDAHGLLIPIMAAAVIAQSVSRQICPKGIYHALADNFAPERHSP